MCKHTAHTTDIKNYWIEYFLYYMNKDGIGFPALSAHVQDGRRGKVSVIENLATHKFYWSLATLPHQHQDIILDSLQNTCLIAWDYFSCQRKKKVNSSVHAVIAKSCLLFCFLFYLCGGGCHYFLIFFAVETHA